MRFILSTVLLVAAIPSLAQESSSPLWGQLEAGPNAVGFRVTETYDRSRPYRPLRNLSGRLREGERGRPIQISIWYPAEKSASQPMTWADYFSLVATEPEFGPVPDDRKRARERVFQIFPPFQNGPDGAFERLRRLRTGAFRDAVPRKGKFPLIVWSLGSAVLFQTSAEYLASHGYVVISAPRIAFAAGLPDTNQDRLDYDSKVRDMEFLISHASALPFVDIQNIGLTGFSAGGRWALLEAMRNSNVKAMVSLDSVFLWDEPNFRTMPFHDPDSVRIPVLHMTRREWVPRENPASWDALRYSDRMSLIFEKPLDHFDFVSAGYASTVTGYRPDQKVDISDAFHAWNRYLLNFFDAHIKGVSQARAFLERRPEQNGVPQEVVTTRNIKALPPPPTDAQLAADIDEAGIDEAISAYRRLWKETGQPPTRENTLNGVAYTRLFTGRADEAISLLELNAEAYPSSSNVYDSLGDAYLQAGNIKRARAMAERALEMLKTEGGLTPERREAIRASAQAKIDRPDPGR